MSWAAQLRSVSFAFMSSDYRNQHGGKGRSFILTPSYLSRARTSTTQACTQISSQSSNKTQSHQSSLLPNAHHAPAVSCSHIFTVFLFLLKPISQPRLFDNITLQTACKTCKPKLFLESDQHPKHWSYTINWNGLNKHQHNVCPQQCLRLACSTCRLYPITPVQTASCPNDIT